MFRGVCGVLFSCFWLSVPVQLIAWKNSSTKWPVVCWVGRQTLHTHSLALLVGSMWFCYFLQGSPCRFLFQLVYFHLKPHSTVEIVKLGFLRLLSSRQLLSNDCLEDKREDYQNCSVMYCVTQVYSVINTLIWAVFTAELWPVDLGFGFYICVCVLSLFLNYGQSVCCISLSYCEFGFQYKWNQSPEKTLKWTNWPVMCKVAIDPRP